LEIRQNAGKTSGQQYNHKLDLKILTIPNTTTQLEQENPNQKQNMAVKDE